MSYPILVRMDDICPWMNLDRFIKYTEMLAEMDIKPLLGLVPECTDDSIKVSFVDGFWDLIREYKSLGYPIAMHGVNHTYVSSGEGLVTKRPKSEFAGLPYEEQYLKLKHGKEILEREKISTDIFFAPGHSYDRNTLKALKKLGFNYISDGRSRNLYKLDGIICIPATGAYRLHLGRGILTICIHSNEETVTDFENLKVFLSKKKKYIISFEEATKLHVQSYMISRIEERMNMFIDCCITKVYSRMKSN